MFVRGELWHDLYGGQLKILCLGRTVDNSINEKFCIEILQGQTLKLHFYHVSVLQTASPIAEA